MSLERRDTLQGILSGLQTLIVDPKTTSFHLDEAITAIPSSVAQSIENKGRRRTKTLEVNYKGESITVEIFSSSPRKPSPAWKILEDGSLIIFQGREWVPAQVLQETERVTP